MDEITINENINYYIHNYFDFLEIKNKTTLINYIKDPNNFDSNFYQNKYPDLKRIYNLYDHYLLYGIKEGRICSADHEKMCTEFNNLYLKKTIENNKLIPITSCNTHFNILIRTSNRHFEFKRCLKSIYDQKYNNITLIISYDNDETIEYIKNENISFDHIFLDIRNHNISKFRYYQNLYCNYLLQYVKNGWVLFLDDDDEIISPNTLHKINNYIQKTNIKEDNLLIFHNYRNDKILKIKDKNNPICGEVAISSYIFHSKYNNISLFNNNSNGDFHFFEKIFKILKPVFCDYPIVKINHYI